MKKVLSLLLAFILIFSCFSILGTTALAEAAGTEELLLESDFYKVKYSSSNANSSRWKNFTSNITYNNENGEYFASINGATSKAFLASPTIKLVKGKTYELSYYLRVPKDCAQYKYVDSLKGYAYVPSVYIYKPGNTSVGQIPTAEHSERTNTYSYNNANFKVSWEIEGYPQVEISKYSLFMHNQFKNIKDANGPVSPNVVFNDWKKVTATFTAVEADAIVSIAFMQYYDKTYAAGCKFDIKDVMLKEEIPTATTKPADTAFNSNFEDSNAGEIEAAGAEAYVKSATSEPTKIGSKYLEYKTTNTTSKGVTVRFDYNKDYTYKISYDLKVFTNGSGSLATSLTRGCSATEVASANELLVYDQSGKMTSAITVSKDVGNIYSNEWKHVEIKLANGTINGSVKFNIVANGKGWNIGIDNIKVEMISNANLENLDDITTGIDTFNIRAESSEKQQGLRFKSEIDFNKLNLTEGAKIVEYGTLVTVATNKAKLKLENVDNTNVLAGVAFDADTGTDIRYSFDNDTGILVYTGVITGITPENYDKELAVCGYTVVKTVSGARFVIYDNVTEISVLDAAKQIVADSQSEDDKAAAQKVINDYNALNQ